MAMVMTKEEIVTMYRDAKDKKAQVETRKDLNLCKQEEIISILREGGVSPQSLPRVRKKHSSREQTTNVNVKKPAVIIDKTQPFLTKNEPSPVTPRKEYEKIRIRELIRGIRDFASAWKPIVPEWIEEYNELVARKEGISK